MADAAPHRHGRINALAVLAEAAGNLRRHARLLPRLAWPALLAALAAELVRQFAVPADSGWQAVTLVKLPFDLMLATAWTRLLLLGRSAARVPALGWGRSETDFLFALIVFALAFLGCVVLTVLIVGNLPLPERTLTLVVAAASWLILTLLTPLALKLPARAAGADLPGRAWQARLGNFPNAAVVWLAFLALAFAVTLVPAQMPQDAGPALRVIELAAAVLADYVILLVSLALAGAMFRQLADRQPPDPE